MNSHSSSLKSNRTHLYSSPYLVLYLAEQELIPDAIVPDYSLSYLRHLAAYSVVEHPLRELMVILQV